MTVAAIVVALDTNPVLQQANVEAFRADARVAVGALEGDYLPLVVETDSAREGAELVEGIAARPGVMGVDVVRIDFDDRGGGEP